MVFYNLNTFLLQQQDKQGGMCMLRKKTVLLALCLFLVVLLTAGCGGASKKITMEKFNKIQDGMSYSQVSSIMGDPGELGASTTMPGIPGIIEKLESKIYMWKNSDGTNMNVQFQNDKVMTKAQFGLK